MKPSHLFPAAALAILLASGCNKNSDDVAQKLAELERKANEAVEKQKALEQQIEDQKIAAERDAIERERMEIEEARAELERQQGDADAAAVEALRQREVALATREGKVEVIQSKLIDEEKRLRQRDDELTERDRELAGREALVRENEAAEAEPVPSGDYSMFHESLSTYGSWFETPDYGYVWQPVIVRDSSWRPYTRGRWACTDRGWTWISDEPFGWATYHYGRWALCRGYGWIWVPGSDWAPSWVSWRSSGSHIGWAPLPPETLAYRNHRWDSTVDITCGISTSWFNFVEIGNFCEPIHYHCLPYTQNSIYIGNTANITNIHIQNHRVICGGPSYGDIERQTKRRPPFYRIEEERPNRPGREPASMRPRIEGNRLRVSAPNLDVAWNEGLKPARIRGKMESIKVERQEEIRPEVAERFRQSREENRRRADESIAEMGGKEEFKVQRLERLEENRQRIGKPVAKPIASADSTMPARDRSVVARTEEQRNPRAERNDGPQVIAPKDRSQVTEEARERIRKQREETTAQTGNGGPNIVAPRDRSQVTEEAKERVRKQREEATAQTGVGGPRIVAPKDRSQVTEEAAERVRKQREEAAGQPNRDGPRISPGRPPANPSEDDGAERARRQQQAQAEQARQQQEAQRQREQARQQQMEEARREQARQQQEESRREQARQQQMEENRREQARQQQMEENRREQARQQQQEENRREQARQQQQEESRREQARQQQQEESRREQARQQQEESQRQERNRQEQRQEEERRGRNR